MSSSVDALAKQLASQLSPPARSAAIVQGVITAIAVSSGSTPPTVSALISGATTATAGLRYVRGYVPVVGDVVQILKQGGSLLVLDAIATAAMPLAPTGIVGPGSVTNMTAGGGANRTTTQPFVWCDSVVVTTGAGSSWTYTTSGTVFTGVSAYHATPGATTNSLTFLSCQQPTISGGNVTVNGAAYGMSFTGLSAGLLIRINLSIFGW